jgi:hypothetical protein
MSALLRFPSGFLDKVLLLAWAWGQLNGHIANDDKILDLLHRAE